MAEAKKPTRKKVRLSEIERALFKMVIPFLVHKVARHWQIPAMESFSGFTSVPYEYVVRQLNNAPGGKTLWCVILQHYGGYSTHVYFLAKTGDHGQHDGNDFRPVYLGFWLPDGEYTYLPDEALWIEEREFVKRLGKKEKGPVLLGTNFGIKKERPGEVLIREEVCIRILLDRL